jgi:hypothetical protein
MVKKTFFKDVLVIRRIVFSIPRFSEKRHKIDGRITTEKDMRTSSESSKTNMVGGKTTAVVNTTLSWDYGAFLGSDRRRMLFAIDL